MSLFWLDRWSLPSSALDVRHRDRRGVLPLGEVLGVGADRADAGLVVAGRNDELIRVEEALGSFVLVDFAGSLALVRIAPQLVDGCRDGFRRARALALDDHDRNAVDEQHDVRGDESLGKAAGAVDAELVDRREGVVLGVLPVDVLDGLRPSLVPVRQAVDGDAGQEQVGSLPGSPR